MEVRVSDMLRVRIQPERTQRSAPQPVLDQVGSKEMLSDNQDTYTTSTKESCNPKHDQVVGGLRWFVLWAV